MGIRGSSLRRRVNFCQRDSSWKSRSPSKEEGRGASAMVRNCFEAVDERWRVSKQECREGSLRRSH